MKTDKNSHPVTPSGTTAQPEQTVPDNNRRRTLKKYAVELSFTQYSVAKVIIEAVSQEQAEEMADELDSDRLDGSDIVDGELSLLSVTPINEGNADE